MSGTVYEYRMVGWLIVFTTFAFICLGLLGIGQLDASDVDLEQRPNLLDGISYFFINPFTSLWSKLIYTILIIAPLAGIVGMAGINLVRGRS